MDREDEKARKEKGKLGKKIYAADSAVVRTCLALIRGDIIFDRIRSTRLNLYTK